MNLVRNKKLIVISVLLVGLLALVGCSDDDNNSDPKTYSASGEVVRKTKAGEESINNFKLKAGDKVTRTNEKGNWSFSGLTEGTKIVPVGNELYTSQSVDRNSITVNKDLSGVKFKVTGEGLRNTDINDETIDYDPNSDNTIITLSFGEDLKFKGDTTFSEEMIELDGLPKEKQFTVHTKENKNEDGDDPEDDYLVDKELVIKIRGRVKGNLTVIIKPGTFESRDPDGNEGTIGMLKSSELSLSSNTDLKAVDSNSEVVNEVLDKEKKVIINWIGANPTVGDLYAQLEPVDKQKPAGSGAEILTINGVDVKDSNLHEDMPTEVNEGDKIKVRAEDGTTVAYTIVWNSDHKNNNLKSEVVQYNRLFSKAKDGEPYYTIKDGQIKSNAKVLAEGVTTIKELKGDLVLAAPDYAREMKFFESTVTVTPNNFANNKHELAGDRKLSSGLKVVVQAKNKKLKEYDIKVRKPSNKIGVASAKEKEGIVLNEPVTAPDTLVKFAEGSDVAKNNLAGVDQSSIISINKQKKQITVEAQNSEKSNVYDYCVVPSIDEAKVTDAESHLIDVEFSQPMVQVGNIEGLKVKINDQEYSVEDYKNAGDNTANGSTEFKLQLPKKNGKQLRVKEGQTVTLVYDKENGNLKSTQGAQLYLYSDEYTVDNKVDSPEVESAEVNDATPKKITLELDQSLNVNDVDRDDVPVKDKFTIKGKRTVEDEVKEREIAEERVKISSNGKQIIIKLKKKVLENENLGISYKPGVDKYFVDSNKNQILEIGVDQEHGRNVVNEVDAPDYKRIVEELTETTDGETNQQIIVEFDQELKLKGDQSKIADDFTVWTKPAEEKYKKKIKGYDSLEPTSEKVKVNAISLIGNDNKKVKLTLNKAIVDGEKVQLSYKPDNQFATTNVLTDADDTGAENVAQPFGKGEGKNSKKGKSVTNLIDVPSITDAEIKDDEANVVYLDFDGAVTVNANKDVSNWFTVKGKENRTAVGIKNISVSGDHIVKLVLADGVRGIDQGGPENVEVTYTPKLRTENESVEGLLEDGNGNQLLRNKVEAANNVESATQASAQVTNAKPGQITVTFDEADLDQGEIADVAVSNSNDSTKGFTLNYNEVGIDEVVGNSSDQIIVKLDGKIKAGDTAKLEYDGSTGNLVDDNENNTQVISNASNDQDVKIDSFTANLDPNDEDEDKAVNNVKAPKFDGARVYDNERYKIYVDFTELLGISGEDIDFNIRASQNDPDFADDNFEVTVDGTKYGIADIELKDHGSNPDEQMVIELGEPITDDDQTIKLTYAISDEHTKSQLNDGDGNVVPKFENRKVTNQLKTPDYESAVVEDDQPNVIKVTFDNPGATSLDNVAADNITTNLGQIIDASVSDNVVKYKIDKTLNDAVETGDQTVTISSTDNLLKDGDGDTITPFKTDKDRWDGVTNNVVGPEIIDDDGAIIKDDNSDEVVVTFNESLASTGASAENLPGNHALNLEKLANKFTITGNTVTSVERTSSKKLTLQLAHKVIPERGDITLGYTPEGYLPDQYGNKATKEYTDYPVTNNVVSNTTVVEDGDHVVSEDGKEITVFMTNPVTMSEGGSKAELDISVVYGGNRETVSIDKANITFDGSKLKVPLNETVKASYGNLTLKYKEQEGSKNNLIGEDGDPVKLFSAPIENNSNQ